MPESRHTDLPLSQPPAAAWRPSLNAYEPSLAAAAVALAKMAADMARGADPYWLTLAGPFGCGKTMLARQLFDHARDHCNPGRFSLWQAGHGIRSEHSRRPTCQWFTADTFAQRMAGLGEWDLPESLRPDYLVVIDDIGRTRDTANATFADALCRLADNRLHRWTLWTTNLTLAEISNRLDARIASRMIRDDNRLITVSAGDYALRKIP